MASPGSISPRDDFWSAKSPATTHSPPSWRGLAPAETLVDEDVAWPQLRDARCRDCASARPGISTRRPRRASCARFFRTRDLSGFGCAGLPLAIAAAGALLGYVEETQKSALPHIGGLAVENATDTIALDAATRRNLELDTNASGRAEHTLLGVLDRTITPMGARSAAPLAASAAARSRRDRANAGRRSSALIDRAALRGLARDPAQHRRSRAHPRARCAALGASARSIDIARRAAGRAAAAQNRRGFRKSAATRSRRRIGEHAETVDYLCTRDGRHAAGGAARRRRDSATASTPSSTSCVRCRRTPINS